MTVVEFWVEQYQAVVAEKKSLGDKLRETLEENKDLQQQINELTRSNETLRGINSRIFKSLASSKHQAQELKMQLEAEKEENESLHNVIDSFVDKCKELEDKAEGYKKKLELLNTVVTPDLDAQLKSMTERLDKSIADRKELQADRDIWFRKNGEKQAEIEELKKKIQSLEDDLEFKTLCRDGWRDRAEKAERQLEEKKQQSYANGYSDGNEEGQNELWEMLQLVRDMQPNEFDPECECIGDVIDMDLEDFKEAYDKWEAEQKKEAEEAKKQHTEYMELQADRDIWFRKNGEKQAEIEELKKKIESLKGNLDFVRLCRDNWLDRAKKAEKELEEIKQDFKQEFKHSYADGYSDGNEEGQNELWEMLQMVKDMQPNEFDVECECLGDVIDMDLEDFKEAYGKWEAEQKKEAEEAKKKRVEYMREYLKRYCIGKLCFGCPLYNNSEPVSSCLFSKLTDEEIEKCYKKASESERDIPTPISARLPQLWECTIEGTVKINEDILKVVCGIKDDKEEET